MWWHRSVKKWASLILRRPRSSPFLPAEIEVADIYIHFFPHFMCFYDLSTFSIFGFRHFPSVKIEPFVKKKTPHATWNLYLSRFSCGQMGWYIPSSLRSIYWTSCQKTAPSSCPWGEWCGTVLCLSTTTSMWTSTTSRWGGHVSAVKSGSNVLPLTLRVCFCSFCRIIWVASWCSEALHQSSR